LPTAAAAAEGARPFSIAQQPYRDALIDLALQADISLLGASACGTAGQASLRGTFTLDQALNRLLARAPCGYRIVDARTVRIFPVAPAHRETQALAPAVDELTVTANRRPQRPDSVPAGVSVIVHDQIRATDAADATDVAGQVAGVITTNLGPGRDKLLIRGLSDGAFTGRARSTVGTYLDDAPINYNAPDPDLRLTDVQQVEVVRGPQGALYGSGALSGVYRIVTRKPDLDHVAAGAASAIDWTDGGSPSREAEGYLNMPLVAGRLGLRLTAYYELQGGYIDDVSMRLSNVDRTHRTGARATLRAQVSPDWLVDVGFTLQHLKSNDTQYTNPGLGGTRRRANRVREAHDNNFAQGSVTVHGDLDGAQLTSSTAYVRHAYSSQYDASAALDLFSATGADLGLFSESARVKMLVQDLVLSSTGQGRLGWLVGANAVDTIAHTPSMLRTSLAGSNLVTAYEEGRSDRVLDLAVYGEATYRLGSGWIVAAGGRVFDTRLKTAANIFAPPPGVSRTVDERRHFRGVSPKISLQRTLGSDALAYALISEGFRAGGVNSAGVSPPRRSRATFEPDHLRNYELGIKAQLLDHRLNIRAAVFRDDWSNIQTDQYLPSGLAYTANVGDARITGLEAEVSHSWDFGLTVQTVLLAVSPKITWVNPDFAAKLTQGLPGTPRLSGGVVALYERRLAHGLKLRTVAEVSYVGRSSLTFDPALSPRMGDYWKTRLGVEVASARWTVGLSIANPTNESGDTFAYGNPFSFGQVRQVTPQRPRTIAARLSATF
jgi:iron complex outermembrane receptor protein